LSSGANLASHAPDATLSGAYAHELAVHCGRWGVSTEALLAGTGLSADALRDPATNLSLSVCTELAERARRLTGQPGLAFTMGMSMRLSWHGFLGFAAMAAGSLREALVLAERFSLTRTAAFTLATHVEGDHASLVLEERVDLGALREFLVITMLVGLGRLAGEVTGKELPGSAECAFPEPDYAAAMLARGSRADVMRFGRPAHRLVFDATLLELPLVGADPAAMELARAQCDRELGALSDLGTVSGRVRREISGVMGTASIEAVARRLGASTRTLKRRLAEEGATFRELHDASRRQRALLLLSDRRLALAEIAARLGYSDVANFTRAFRRWTGVTPGAHRAR
jgi:AraC-like DNA-binding protein